MKACELHKAEQTAGESGKGSEETRGRERGDILDSNICNSDN